MERQDSVTPEGDPMTALGHDRALLLREATRLGGTVFARRHSDLFDRALSQIWDGALRSFEGSPEPLALVALGGYGRRELCPYSDIDLMVLHWESKSSKTASVSEAVFYPLWNAGFDVGHAARSVKDCVALASEEVAIRSIFPQEIETYDPYDGVVRVWQN